MTTLKLESAVIEYMQSEFDKHVKPDIIDWMKKNNIRSMEFSMGGALFTTNLNVTFLDDDIAVADSPHNQFYKEYIEPIVMTRKNKPLLYGIDFDIHLK